MLVYNANHINLRPLSALYAHDQDVKVEEVTEYFETGHTFNFAPILSAASDATINKNNHFYLTNEKQRLQDNTTITSPISTIFPVFITTYVKVSGQDIFLVENLSNGTTELSGTSALINNNYYLEIELIDPESCTIRYFDGSELKFLTWVDANYRFEFLDRDASTIDYSSNLPDFVVRSVNSIDKQTFTYIFNDDKSALNLFKITASGTNILTYNPEAAADSNDEIKSRSLSAKSISAIYAGNIITTNNTFEIIPVNKVTKTFNLSSNYIIYDASIEDNNLNVDEIRSASDVGNNFLLSVPRLKVEESQLSFNFHPLKNQITPEGTQGKSSPYEDDNNTRHRVYRKLHTGVNQQEGFDSIYLNYHGNTTQVLFKPGRITYFRIPQKFTPYVKLNINDSALITAGAIASNSPLVSDKVFKNRVDDKKTETQKNEINGTLLCTWLSGNDNKDTTPIWVDRYYNPNYASASQSLSTNSIFIDTLKDNFKTVVEKLSAEKFSIFDKRSDFLFEIGSIYAYHRVGDIDFSHKIESNENNIIFKDLDLFKTFNNIDVNPEIDTTLMNTKTLDDGSVVAIDDQNREILVPKIYDFNVENRYGKSIKINDTGSFTLLFSLYSKDWQRPFANQIIGNYVNKGLSFHNENIVTPLITIPHGASVLVYNTNFDLLKRYPLNISGNIKAFTRGGTTENFWIVDDSNHIYEYDLAGVIQRKIIPVHSAVALSAVHDIEIDPDYIYFSFHNAPSTAFRYDFKNETEAIVSIPSRGNTVAQDVAGVPVATRIHTSKRGTLLTGGVIGVNSDSLSGNTSVLDLDGNPWWRDSNLLYTYDTASASNIVALSASTGGYIEQVNVDKYGDVWVLHDGTTLTKLTSGRNVSWTTDLTATPLSGRNRFIDFIYEFQNQEYNEYAIILTQALTAGDSNVIKVNRNGTVRDVISLSASYITPMSGWKTITGFDYLKKHEHKTNPSVTARIKLRSQYTDIPESGYDLHELPYDITNFTPGWHAFGIKFDSENGIFSLHVDGQNVQSITLSAGKYSFFDTFTSPIFVGTNIFFNGIPLSNFIEQKNAYFSHNIKMKDISLYDKALTYHDMMPYVRRTHKVRDLKWDIPIGQRSYLDTVERNFKFGHPGRKSELFNINVANSDITDGEMRNVIEDKLRSELKDIIPIYTRLNNINWKSTNPLSSFAHPLSTINTNTETFLTEPSAGNSGYGL
tara:strand:+ start:959 stop:4576 length:3618 start_codon:yes stop_codon:yes gene_type:complete